MEGIRSIVARFPQRELEIRRCYMRDAQFQAICADYEEAMRALRHWQHASEKGDAEGLRNATDYENLVAELEQEVLTYLV
jgi:predicted hydrolase (HD superfamily)